MEAEKEKKRENEDSDPEEDGQEDSHVAAYRDFIIQMEREIAVTPDGPSPPNEKEENRNVLQPLGKGLNVPMMIVSDSCVEKNEVVKSDSPNQDSDSIKSNGSSGRNSPFRNRVEPLSESVHGDSGKNLSAISESSSNLDDMFVSSRRPLITSEFVPEYERNGKTNSPDSGVEHDLDSGGLDRPVSKPSLGIGSKRKISDKNYTRRVFVRTFKERASQENFALYGLLTPALCLVPSIDGNDALTECFTELKGEDRELKLAAAHIDDAITGRGKYGRARAFFKSRQGRWSFNVLVSNWFHYLVLTMATIHIALTFFEPPPNPESTSLVAIIITPFCLMVYIADVAVHMVFLSWKVFWQWNENKWQRVEFVFVIMFILDYIMLVIQWILARRLWQVFRCLRAGIILCKLKNVQHVYDVVMSIVIKLGKVFLIIIIFILMFSAVGVNLFLNFYHCIGQNTTLTNCTESEDEIYTGSFDNVAITFLRLFVLLSTENYPEFMIPAYSQSKATFIYFGIFLFVGVFFLTAILLAIVVDSYWEFAKKHVKEERGRERAELAKAWNLLDPLGKGSLPITDDRFLKLFKILKPSNTEDMNMQLINYLDSNNDGEIDSLEWTIRLNETLSFEFEMEDFRTDQCGPKWMRTVGGFAQKIVRSDIFSKVILILIVLHCALFCLVWYGMPYSVSLIIQITKTVILAVFVVEIMLSIFGECLNLLHVIEVLDILLILIALAANVVWYFIDDNYQGVCNVIAGIAVAFRVGFNSLQTKKTVVMFFTKIFPVMSDLIILILIIGYFYSVLGWESFSYVQPNASYEADHYNYECGLGFETFACSMLIVFQIVTTSNWHEIMNSAMLSTSSWSCIYFVTCFLVINMVVMNLFVAIAIEAFNKLGKEKELETENSSTQNSGQQEEATIADSAKTFLNNLFESSKAEQSKERIQRAGGSPRMRRPSRVSVTMQHVPLPGLVFEEPSPNHLTPFTPIVNHNSDRQKQENVAAVEEEEEEEEEEEDLSHLTPQERKRKMMKKKLERKKKKKKRAMQMIVVTTAFRASKDQEISLNVGEQVEILQKQDEWWEGRVEGRQGWFPSSHVKEMKRGVAPTKTRHMSLDSDTDAKPPLGRSNTTPSDRTQSLVHQPSFEKASSSLGDTLNSSLSSTGGRSSKPRLKLRNSGNWRKEILGDITVINPQELRELNKILKAQHSISSTSKLNSTGSMKKSSSISESIEEEPEAPDVVFPVPPPTQSPPKPKPLPPKISFERAPTLPLLIEEEEEEEEEKEGEVKNKPPPDTLTVEQPRLPPEVTKKRNKEKNKSGEMPSWMAKFVETNNLSITTDVKFDEEKPADGENKSEDDTIESNVTTNQSIPGIVIEEDTSV